MTPRGAMSVPDRLYNVMHQVGRLHGYEVAGAINALCAQACTGAAMTGALVASGVHPAEAVQTVKSWEAAGLTIPPEIRMVRPARAIPGITGLPGITGVPGILGVPTGLEAVMGITPWGVRPGITGLEMYAVGAPWGVLGDMRRGMF